jgi:hypothetical protein
MTSSRVTAVFVGIFLSVITALALLPVNVVNESDSALANAKFSRIPLHISDSNQAPAGNTGSSSGQHPLDPLLVMAENIRAHIQNDITDYTAKMVKRERISGKLGVESQMQLKVRNRSTSGEAKIPLSAYLLFSSPKSVKGREVIWVEGANDNCLISHEAGMFNLKRFVLEPTGMLAMMGNKYPITEIGLLRLAEKLIEKGERDRALGTCVVEVIDGQLIGDRECRLYQITHPEPKDGFDFHIAQIFVDVERQIPLRYAAFLWPKGSAAPPLEEEYTFLDVRINVGLTDADFDPDNPDYDFP